MLLSIIIVNYNVQYFLEQCLCSVKAAIENIDAEVIVADNNSSDDSVPYLRRQFAWVRFIALQENTGFARANNIALQQAMGQYVVFLNPDTIIPEHIFQKVIAFAAATPGFGALGVQMIDGSGQFLPESKRAFPGPRSSFFKLCGLASLFPRSAFFNRYALGHLSGDGLHEVDVLCGAFLLAERKLLLSLHGFDESFFMYGEDIDLCYRIQQAGKKIWYFGSASILHFKGESSKQDPQRHIRRFYEAMSVFVQKHYTGSSAWLMRLMLQAGITAGELLSSIQHFFRKKSVREPTALIADNAPIMLTGDITATAEAAQILEKQFAPTRISRIQPGTIESVEAGSVLVFCTGAITYETSIGMMKKYNNRFHYYWHGAGTKSIVGSSIKEVTGTVFTASADT